MKKWICLPLCALLLTALFCAGQVRIATEEEHAIRVYFTSHSIDRKSVV